MNDKLLCSDDVNNINLQNIVVILPTYNEELSIAAVIKDFYFELPDVPIWVIDNNSKDKTSEIASETLRELGARGGVIFENKQGKSNAVKRAFVEIVADIYIMADADATYPASEVHKLLSPILAGKADIVVGDRHSSGEYAIKNDRSFHGAGNKLVNTLINFLFRTKINDAMSGYRAMTRQFVDLYPIMKNGFELESEMTIHAISNEFRIQEVPIVFSCRPEGSDSKLNTFSDGFKVLKIIMLLFRNYKPLIFFSLCAAFFSLSSLFVGIPVFHEYLTTGYILRIPSAILASGLAIFGTLLFVTGLILDVIISLHRSNFELLRMRYSRDALRTKGKRQD